MDPQPTTPRGPKPLAIVAAVAALGLVALVVAARLAFASPVPLGESGYAKTWFTVYVKRSCKLNPLMGSFCLDPGGVGRGYTWQQIPGAQARSFVVLAAPYAKDAHHVYVQGGVLAGAEAESFQAQDGVGRDAHRVWESGFRLVSDDGDLDGSTFAELGCGVVKDANGVYTRVPVEREVEQAPTDPIEHYERVPLDTATAVADGVCHLADASGGWKVKTELRDNLRVSVVERD